MYYDPPGFHATEHPQRARERHRREWKNRRNDGSEALRAKPLPPRAKAVFAVVAFLTNGSLAVVAYAAGFIIVAVALAVLAVLMIVDLGWQIHKLHRAPAVGHSPAVREGWPVRPRDRRP